MMQLWARRGRVKAQRVNRLVLVAVALLLLAGCSSASSNQAAGSGDGHSHGGSTTTQRAARGSDLLDQQFIDMMVPHHQGAVEMARIARLRAERPEVKQMGRSIISDQYHEIDRMKQWRLEWFGSDATPPMEKMPMIVGMSGHGDHQTMDMAADVEALRVASGPFDKAFIDAMIPHHQSALDAAKAVLDKTERPQVRFLAQAIIADQTREIEQMKQWRKSWYGSAEPGK